MKTIDPLELEALMETGRPVEVIDVRMPQEFRKVHALGVRSVPLNEFAPTALLRTREGKPSDPLYIMCRNETRAKLAAEELEMAGFENSIVVQGGIEAWDHAGLPVVRAGACGAVRNTLGHSVLWLLVALGVVLGVTAHPAFLLFALMLATGILLLGMGIREDGEGMIEKPPRHRHV